MELHGIPCNLMCANVACKSRSMEFHGTWSAPTSLTEAVPWNSMEFHGTWSTPISWNSMELGLGQIGWNKQFHRTPWNLGCTNFADTSSSSDFYGLLWNLECHEFDDMSSSMELRCVNFVGNEAYQQDLAFVWYLSRNMLEMILISLLNLRLQVSLKFKFITRWYGFFICPNSFSLWHMIYI